MTIDWGCSQELAFAAFGLAFLLPPFDYPRALYGGISLLVPSTIVTLGVHELTNEQLEAGTIRLVYGLLGFGLLGAGVAAAFNVGKLFGLEPPHVTATEWMPAARASWIVASRKPP